MKTNLKKHFGDFLCNDQTLKKYMSAKNFKMYVQAKRLGEALSPKVAHYVAKAIKTWATEKRGNPLLSLVFTA